MTSCPASGAKCLSLRIPQAMFLRNLVNRYDEINIPACPGKGNGLIFEKRPYSGVLRVLFLSFLIFKKSYFLNSFVQYHHMCPMKLARALHRGVGVAVACMATNHVGIYNLAAPIRSPSTKVIDA